MADNEAPQDVKENTSIDTAQQDTSPGDEDWDKAHSEANAADSGPKGEGDDSNFGSFGRSHGRGLAQLMSPHALKGKDIVLSEEEEKELALELGKWINADSNPYEAAEDPYFKNEGTN
ncbi:hypothetical protein PIIN_00484 [Serendipita indica DSM 11827]|uniref:Uncharacterized protein n=1 Tax=Serendipita indica (strain DSM 11827) TaxID=1109443 RepID=G4U2M5_SERID|nr:hypothetical protein PIIN_00484 [Serendipita indica DSM 11827]